MVPFCPVCFRVPLLKPTSRKKGTLVTTGLLRNLVSDLPWDDRPSIVLTSRCREHQTDAKLMTESTHVCKIGWKPRCKCGIIELVGVVITMMAAIHAAPCS